VQPGASSSDVARELEAFEQTLQRVVARLDDLCPPDVDLTVDSLGAVLDLCAWAHAEWVRIHPFANSNGRTARLLAVSLAVRYGLPAFVRVRPRPDAPYGAASAAAMRGGKLP
jgi:hypothetical protein